ncbi:MAG: hypothetical protein LBT42_03665 [Tannerella sp.]|jgi:hypothetical protein|nr:hypothetical protein [Tannerella sp.]
MKTNLFKKAIMLAVALFMVIPFAKAQVEVSAGGDIVSSYIWRGQDLGGVSIQPSASVSVGGLSLSAWGSVGIESYDTKEFDFTLGYSTGGLSLAITDYWFNTSNNYFDYASHTTAHMFEATLGYDFGPLALSWNTYFAGTDYLNEDGSRSYSTYIEASAPFKLGGLDLKAELGLTPWEGLYSDKFNVVNIGITVSKEITVTESFAIPAFTKICFSPNAQTCFLVFGISL